MRRRLLNIAGLLSALLLAASVAMWIRSHGTADFLAYKATSETNIESSRGSIEIRFARLYEAYRGQALRVVPASEPSEFQTWHASLEWVDERDGWAHFDAEHYVNNYVGVRDDPHWWQERYSTSIVLPYWMIAATTGTFAAWRGWRVWLLHRNRRRSKTGLCVRCGYDLRASAARCPECGQDFAA